MRNTNVKSKTPPGDPYHGNSAGHDRQTGGETMHHFTPLSGLIGGALIGLAFALLMLSAGRPAGVSGILGGLLTAGSDRAWRLAFIAGLIAAALIGPEFGTPGPARLAAANLVLFAIAR